MRHLLPIFCFLTFGLASCTGCSKKNTTTVCTGSDCAPLVVSVPIQPDANTDATSTVPAPPFDSARHVLSGIGWELTLPEGFNTVVTEDEEQPEVLVVNKEEHSIVLLIKEPFEGLAPEYVISAVRGIAEASATLNASTYVEINGNKYMLLDSAKQGMRVWTWLAVKNGFGYSLSCSGSEKEDHHEALCAEVADSLKLH